ncbi:MAG: DUF58 domain-containing protein [Planctomycetota bacterium]|jgi:uncharacterized protein (DUF58 family)
MASGSAITTGELFDPAFREAVGRLHLVARRVARGGRPAEQRSRDLGSGIEFRDFRPYSPGDDFRAIDWNIYRRLGRVFLRLFEELEDLPVYLAPDVSESAFLEEDPRARTGLRAAFALASIALNQHDRVGVFPFGADLSVALRPQSGRGRALRIAETLAGLEARGSTDFRTSFRRFSGLGLREGLLVVISDFFDPGGIEAIREALGPQRHRLLLVPLWRASDRDPDLTGDVELVDCETGESEDVSITAPILERVRVAHDAFHGELRDFARRRGAGILRLDCDREVVPQLAELFEGGRYEA